MSQPRQPFSVAVCWRESDNTIRQGMMVCENVNVALTVYEDFLDDPRKLPESTNYGELCMVELDEIPLTDADQTALFERYLPVNIKPVDVDKAAFEDIAPVVEQSRIPRCDRIYFYSMNQDTQGVFLNADLVDVGNRPYIGIVDDESMHIATARELRNAIQGDRFDALNQMALCDLATHVFDAVDARLSTRGIHITRENGVDGVINRLDDLGVLVEEANERGVVISTQYGSEGEQLVGFSILASENIDPCNESQMATFLRENGLIHDEDDVRPLHEHLHDECMLVRQNRNTLLQNARHEESMEHRGRPKKSRSFNL